MATRSDPKVSALNLCLLGLAALLALELYGAVTNPAVRRPAPPATFRPAGDDSAARAAAVAGWRETVLARPLFDPSRRPAASAAPAAPAAVLPRLSGIMVTPTEKIAVFSPAMGPPLIVSRNSRFGPFQVLSIAGDSVTVKGPDGVRVLTSNFSGHAVAAASTPLNTILSGGIDLTLIRGPLPSALNWPGPPQPH